MKELSIEEKAQRYDKAIERAKELQHDNCWVTSIFPELKESEDEKIRKMLIAFVKNDCIIASDKNKQDVLTWLENKGEQKPETIFLKFRIGDKVTNGEYTYTINFIGKDCYWVKEHDCATIPFEYQHNWKLVEQNLAWSEEDENAIKVLMNIIKKSEIIDSLIYTDLLKEKLYDWLKSIKDRVQPQPKQEWSVEGRSKIQRICKYLNEAKKYYADITEIRECIDWLKSLRPQNRWKPSKEQIIALRWVLNNVPYNKHKEEISGLLEQIKDL